MTEFLVLLQLITGFLCLSVAASSGFGTRPLRRLVPTVAAHRPIRVGIGILALLAAVGEFAGIVVPPVAFFASCLALAVAFTLWLARTATRSADSLRASSSLAAAALGVACLQPLGLKVMLLPKADRLPYEPVEASVAKTYDEGVWFESVRAGADGTLYLAANVGLDFSRHDYYRHARGEVIARHPDGSEKTLFSTPEGSAAGVFAVAGDGTLYMSSNADTPGIWRIRRDGTGEMMTKLPAGAWPNGLDFGPDGRLYAPDSALGAVWRISPQTGEAVKALEDKLLRARRLVSLAPGANGLHFRNRDMIVTVSDAATVLRYTLGADGRFGPAVILASGIPGDDFAVGKDGSLFITTHPYNTLVRLKGDGTRAIVGDVRQHIVGATDATFGRGRDDQDTLYVVTDGGAFTGGPKTRGQLIALRPYSAQRGAPKPSEE